MSKMPVFAICCFIFGVVFSITAVVIASLMRSSQLSRQEERRDALIIQDRLNMFVLADK